MLIIVWRSQDSIGTQGTFDGGDCKQVHVIHSITEDRPTDTTQNDSEPEEFNRTGDIG